MTKMNAKTNIELKIASNNDMTSFHDACLSVERKKETKSCKMDINQTI